MKVSIVTGGFPTKDNPSKSIFNYRAALGLTKVADVKVYQYRFWRPGRQLKHTYNYEGVEVTVLALPWIPTANPFINAFNLLLWQRLTHSLIGREINETDIVHSIGLEITPAVTYTVKKNKKKHVAQTVGSDLLIYLPKLEKYAGIRNWIKATQVVICNSDYLKKAVVNRYNNLLAEVAYRGTDLSKFSYEERSSEKRLKVLFLGGFSFRANSGMGSDLKGGETLKKIWEHFDQINTLDVDLMIGGPDSDGTNQVDWKKSLNHPDQVEILGKLSPNDIPSVMKKADIVLLPSKSEGLPNVVVEACASGKIVLASSVGGVPEIIDHEKNGFLLDANNIEEWIKTLEYVLENFEKFKPMGKQASDKMAQVFNAENYPKRLLEIYNLAIQN